MKISHQQGRKHVVIGPKPLSNHTRWCGLGNHAKKALEGGGSCAHLLARHPKWGYYMGGNAGVQGSNSSSSKSKKQSAPMLQQQQLIQQQQPKRQHPATGGTTRGKQPRHSTPQIAAAAAAAARQREHGSMDVDGEDTEGDLFENAADAMDEDDGNTVPESWRGGEEDPPDDDSTEAGDENPSTM